MRFLNGWPLPGAYFFIFILAGALAGQRQAVEIKPHELSDRLSFYRSPPY